MPSNLERDGYEVLKDETEEMAMSRAEKRRKLICNETQGEIYRFGGNRAKSAINQPGFYVDGYVEED